MERDIEALQEKIIKRNEILSKRARTFQKSGNNMWFLDIFLDSNSLSDLISRLNAVTMLLGADKDLLKKQKNDLDLLKTNKVSLTQSINNLSNIKSEYDVSVELCPSCLINKCISFSCSIKLLHLPCTVSSPSFLERDHKNDIEF